MRSARHLSVTPGTAIALVALFFALGGSAFAVGERIQSPSVAQQRCANGAVRGIATVTGIASQGMANIPDKFTSANNLFSRKFNCTGRAVQVRRVDIGVFEVRFVGNCGARAQSRGGIGRLVRDRERSAPARSAFSFTMHRAGRTTAPTGAFIARRRVATGSVARRTRRCLPR